MATFTLRTAAGASGLRTATLDTLRPRSFTAGWHLYVNGTDAITRIPLQTWRISDPGPGATGRLEADHIDPTRSYGIGAGAFVELVNGTTETVYWSGYVSARQLLPTSPSGTFTRIEAVDIGRALDTIFIVSDTTPAGEDRVAIQYLVSRYGNRGLSAPDVTIAITNAATPAVTIANLTLRQALELVADAAGGDRFVYVNAYGQVAYGQTSLTTAPYAITDNAPNGTTTIAASELDIDYDESEIVNSVYVTGATDYTTGDVTYAAWVEDSTSIATYGRRDGTLQNEAVVDATTATLYGSAYLAKVKDPKVRGRFVVEGYDGWAAGQAVVLTSTPLGLSAATYQITEVTTTWLVGTGRRRYEVAFGELPKSLVRAIAAG